MKKRSYLRSFLFTFSMSLVAMFLASFMLVNGMSLSENGFVLGLLQVCSIFIFGTFFYSLLWTEGDRDRNLVDMNRLKKDLLRGVKIGALVMIPYMLTSVFLILDKYNVLSHGDFLFRLTNSHLMVMVNAVLPTANTDFISTTGINILSRFMEAVSSSEVQWWQIIVVTLYHLIVPAICGLAYWTGFHRIDITHNLVYRKKKDKKKVIR